MQRLLYIPNRSGLRPIFLKDYEWVKQGLNAITDLSDTQISGQTVVYITAPHFTKPRYLKPSLIPKVLNGGNIKSEYTSAHSVCTLNDQGHHFHLKQKPSHPLMEYAIHNLSSRIAGKLTPSVELVRFEVHSNGRKKSYPVLISETIPGINLKNAKGPYNAPQYTWMLLLAILTRPGDGRLSNYIVGDNGMLYCVDNDISFAEPVIKEWGSRVIYFCSALFCLTRLDTPLHVETLKEFGSLDGDAIFNAWVEDIIAKEEEYTSLFSKEEIATLYSEDANNTFTPTILFREGTLATLSLQFWQLQNRVAFFLAQGKVITAGDLLKELISLREEAIGNYIYKAYNNTEPTPEKRLQRAISRKQEQSITSAQSHLACLGKIPTLQEIETNKLFSPQKAREEFFFTLLQRNSQYASVKRSQGKTVIEANFKELKQETRRQTLVVKALTQQFKMMEQKPATIIFNHSNVLTSDLLEPFLHTGLESLDLRYCDKIDDKTISMIQKLCPNLKELSIAGCIGIKDVSGSFFSPMLVFPNLEDLDISHCTRLQTLKLEAPFLLNLKARNNPLLQQLHLISYIAGVDFIESPQVALTHTKPENYLSVKIDQGKTAIEINLEPLKQDERKQTVVINALIQIKQKYETLIFYHTNVLTSDLLESFLRPSLERLGLCYCEKIDNKAVSVIQKQCPNLKALSLAGCIGVTEITESFSHQFTDLEHLDVSHCSNLHTLKLQAPSLLNLRGSHNPLLKEVKLGNDVVKTASPQVDITRPPSFGKKEWVKYFGEIGVEPPLPQNIHEILNSPCPFWEGKIVSDTHLLILVPATVNKEPLSPNSLEELIQKPKQGHKTQYEYYNDYVKNELWDQSISSHWVLMTRDVIPDSRNKTYEDQKKLIAAHAQKSEKPYELPTALDAVTCILMEHVQTGVKLYSDNPLTYTRCQEKVNENQWPVVIGGFASGGLDVNCNRWGGTSARSGVGGCRKFWTLVFGTWTREWTMVFGGKTGRS